MKLYKLLSTSNYKLVQSLFPADVIKRAYPYINQADIFNINYDPAKEICTAVVYGSSKYKVSIELGHREGIVPQCTCPASRDWTPFCKHAAALVIVIVEYFSGWDKVKARQQDYYKTLLDKVFDDVKKQHEFMVTRLLPAFTKPTIVFVRVDNVVHPHIVLTHGNEKTNKIARTLEKSTFREFDSTLERLFERTDLFDYAVYAKDGIVFLEFDKTERYTPVWQLKQFDATTTEMSFVCKNNTGEVIPCIPLGADYVIDLASKKIISVQVLDRHCYKFLNEAALDLILETRSVAPQQAAQPLLGTVADIAKFLAEKYQISLPKDVKRSTETIEVRLAFPDRSLQTARTHLALLDMHSMPLEPKLIPSELRVRATADYAGDIDCTVALHVNGKDITFAWPIGHRDFFEFVNTAFQKDYESAFPAMVACALSFRNPQITLEQRKEVFFSAAGTKGISESFFLFMHDFYAQMSSYDSCKVTYQQEAGTFSYFVFNKAGLFTAILALIDFLLQHKQKFDVHDRITSVSTTLSRVFLGRLSEYLQEIGIPLFFENKKVVQRNFSVEVDMESDDDWFSIKPSFYEKDNLLSEDEWQQLLSATGLFQETETEFRVFDEKTEKMLAALRTVKDSYKAKKADKDAKQDYFEIPRLHIFTLLSLNKSGIKLKASDEDKAILKSLHNFTHIPASEIPAKLQCVMRDYQKKGYDWLAFLYKHKFGACLADEMGLGKTVQTIAFLAGIHEGKITSWDTEHKRRHLIVAPASVVGNWEQELKKFYPEFITTLYLGTQRSLDADLFDIVLTTYDTLRSDLEIFKKTPFHVAIFDEAQAVKNSKSQRTVAVQQLQALFKLSLTGTPLENNAQEMCSIMNITLPGLLPEDSVVNQLIKKGEYQAFHEKIAPFVLRRTKKEYLHDLPEKTEQNVYLPMTKKQKGVYGAIVDEVKQQVYKAYREKTKAQAGIIALTALLRLRQICAAPALVDDKQEKMSPKVEYLLAEIAKYSKDRIPLLVFSQFIGMLDIVMHFLQKNKIPYLRIDGSIPAAHRKQIVEDFQKSNKIFVLLLSLKTGGVGLNLTRARVVIHLDPWWNPAVENQASDRAHRIGQEHEVKVIRLLMKDSVEEKMLVLKQKKKELFDAIMEGASGARGTALSKQDFDFLLT